MPATTTPDGARISWELDGDASLPPLVLLHALGTDPSLWARARGSFRTLRVDLRGHGASDVDDVAAVMKDAGIDRAAVAGVAFGGTIAMQLAADHPARVSALALVCTSTTMDPVRDRALLERVPSLQVPALVVTAAGEPGDGDRLLAALPDALHLALPGRLAATEVPERLGAALVRFLGRTTDAAEAALFDAGLANRRRVLGDAFVDRALAARTDFNADFQEFITRIAWHEIWGRPGLDERTRRLLVVVITASLGRWDEFRIHVRAGLEQKGFTRDELKEALMQTAIYAGVPAANTAFAEAMKLLAELTPAETRP